MPRRWIDLPLRVKALAVISIPLVPLVISAGLFAWSARRAQSAEGWVAHTLEVKAQIATVLSLMVDAEMGVRGFLLTRNPESLHPYEDATARHAAAMAQLSILVADNSAQVDRVRTVGALATGRPLSDMIAYARTTNAQPPLSLLADSRHTMDAVRNELAEMQGVEDRLLEARTATATRAQRQVVWIGALGAVFGLVGGLFAAVTFTSGVVSRIDRLGENAVRLSQAMPLMRLKPAADEVGHLGGRLEEAGALLRARVQELEQARADLDRFFSLSLDMLCIFGLDGRFVRVNAAWQDLFAWTPEELAAVPYLDLVHPDDRAPTSAAAAQLADGATVINFENRYRCKDGTYRWLNWKASPEPLRGVIYATARDVTEQKRIAQERAEHAAALAVVNDELEAFSYSVSHDLRAPLRHVAGFASLLERHAAVQLDDQGRRYITTIQDAATTMGRLIDDLLTFSRMGRSALTTRRVHLSDIVQEAREETMSHVSGRDIVWTIHPLLDVDADPAMLRLAFVNLLSNAIKYTATRPQAHIEIGAHGHGNQEMVIFVRDNGVGFDMQYAHKLFGVFQRLHARTEFEGTGIGLANVRRIIHRHGGRTWAEGIPDGGATFYFSLPKERILGGRGSTESSRPA
jgi:PAS domain S-box-containing protein